MSLVQDSRNRMHVRKQRVADRISDLPPNVTQSILQCLPLRDAARTSILSRHWRYKWLSLPWLVLDEKFLEAVMEKIKMSGTLDTSEAYLNVVNKIMLRHAGPVHKFVFHVPSCIAKGMDISDWVQFVSNHGVKEFSLHDSYYHPKVKLPSCLFSYVGLTHLTLINAYIPSLPSTFSGFPSFISLRLKLSYEKSFHLSNGVGCQGKLANEPGRWRTLKLLELPLTCSRAILFAICLLRSSPLLQQLIINAAASKKDLCTGELPEVDEGWSLQCLKKVEITGISGLSRWLQLIKLLLACSPVLENMVIELSEEMGGAEEKLKMAKELMLYHRASPKMGIIFNP